MDLDPMENNHPSATQSLSRLIKVLIGIPILICLAGLVAAAYLYFSYLRDLPDISSISSYDPPVISEVFDINGVKIGEFWKEKRMLTAFENIPPLVIKAFVASEDARFYEHTGVDFRSIARAFIKNLKAGRVVQGGSTITQQVARSLLLTRERTFARKIKEAILATQIEQDLDKNEILYLYLNQIYLGNRAYGVQAAAWNYFHKPLEELHLAEITMIAGLPSAPAEFAPTRNIERSKKQQQRVLERMIDAGFITKEQAKEAYQQTLKVFRSPTDKEFNARYIPYFTEYIRRQLTDSYGSEKIYNGGLKIYTTVDWKIQTAAQEAVKNGLHVVDRRQGFRGPLQKLSRNEWNAFTEKIHTETMNKEKDYFFIPPPPEALHDSTPFKKETLYQAIVTHVNSDRSLDVTVGHIKGRISKSDREWVTQRIKPGWVLWVQLKEGHSPAAGVVTPFTLQQKPKVEGALFSMDPITGEVKAVVGGYDFNRSEYNRATQAYRQLGSGFKPIVYAAALDKGYTPLTSIADAPVTFQVGERSFWSPQNYGRKYSGPLDFASALKHSINIIAVKIFHDIGIDYTIAFAHKLGMKNIKPYLSSALGATDTHVAEVVRTYSVFPALGVLPKTTAILRIKDKEGKILQEHTPPSIPKHEVMLSLQEKDELNSKLISLEEEFIDNKKLKLTSDELKILYGARIPPEHVLSPQTAFIMTRLMKNVVDGGTGYRARIPEWEIGGKTGTTNKETDAWFIGYTANLSTGVWVGYENKRRLGRGMTGGVVAAPIWNDFMKAALAGQDPIPLPVPNGLSVASLDDMTGGSALYDTKREALVDSGDEIPEGVDPNRASDFLFEDFEEIEEAELPNVTVRQPLSNPSASPAD
jgi:penicillin-binding protein 1A